MEANSERGFAQRVMGKAREHGALSAVTAHLDRVLRSCMRGHGVGELAMPDRLFIRYQDRFRHSAHTNALLGVVAQCELAWIEFKKPGEKPRADQIAWHEAERRRGALVLVVSDIDDFMKRWYPGSGLQRKR